MSKRVYKPAFTHDVAKGIILQGAGTQFDPDIVTAFVQCEAQFRIIADQWQRQRSGEHTREREQAA